MLKFLIVGSLFLPTLAEAANNKTFRGKIQTVSLELGMNGDVSALRLILNMQTDMVAITNSRPDAVFLSWLEMCHKQALASREAGSQIIISGLDANNSVDLATSDAMTTCTVAP